MELPEFDPIVDETEEPEASPASVASPETPVVPETEAKAENKTGNETLVMQSSSVERKPHPWIKRMLLISLSVFAPVLLASFILAFCFEDKVADAVLTRVYRVLDTEVRHDKVSLNLWRKFPNATVEVHNLEVDAKGADKNLARIRRVYLQFNLFDVIRGNYRLKKAEIQNVDLNLHVYADTTHSWDIFTPEEDTSETAFSLQLSSVQLSRVKVRYWDETSRLRLAGEVRRVGLRGDLTQKKFALNYSAQVLLQSLDADTSFHWENVRLKSGGEVDVNMEENRYRFRCCALSLNKEELLFDGGLRFLVDSSWQYVLRAEAKSLSAADLLKELPASLRQAVNDYRISGQLQLKLSASGRLCAESTLHLKSHVTAWNMEVWQKKNQVGLQQAAFVAEVEALTPDLLSSLKIRVRDFTAELPSGNVKAGMQMENLRAPQVRLRMHSVLRLQDLKDFLPQLAAYRMGGNAEVDLHFENTFTKGINLQAESFRQVKLSGNLRLSDGLFQMDTTSLRMENFVAQLTFFDQMLIINRFDGKIQGNECRLSAKINPLFDFLFSDDKLLNVSATLTSPYVNVDAFMPSSSTSSASAAATAERGSAFVLPDRVRADVQIVAERLKYDRFESSSLKGLLHLQDRCLSVQQFSMEALGGKVRLQGEARPQPQGNFLFKADAHTDNVDIQRLFYVLHDFGQEQNGNGLTHKNIRGDASADVRFSACIDSKFEMIPESVDCDADLMVTDGRLIDYKILEALSSFVSIDELKDIRFETLRNRISVRNSVIQIPEMEIKNSLVNLNVSGNQSFKGDLHYNIKMHVSELLAHKRRSRIRSDEFGTVEEDASKGMRLYLLVAGTTDHPEFKWNREKAREGFRENLQTQREELRSLFSTEKNKTTSSHSASSTQQKASPAVQRKEEKKRLNDARQKQSELEVGEDW